MSIEAILSSGLSAIQTNSAALRVTANNVANVNTPGYVRREAQQQTLTAAGQVSGVTLGDVSRVVNTYFDKEVMSAQGSFSRYDTQSTVMDQLNAALGEPGDGASLSSKLDSLYAALGQATVDPALMANRQGTLDQFQSLADSVSDLANSVAGLRQSADQQIGVTADSANALIKQLYTLNGDIRRASVGGDGASGLLDQRDQTLQQLSQLIGIRTSEQPDGRLFVSTQDGVSLIGDTYSELSYQPSSGPSYHPLTIQAVDGRTGQPIGTSRAFDAHSSSGTLRGLIDMRDGALVQVGEELGAFAQSLSNTFNAQHNANTAVPPPGTMTGRQTALLGTDTLNFSGATTIGIADSDATLQHKIAINFGAGTLSVDGGASVSIGTTIGSFTTALNTALGANGTASFSNGVLTLKANGGNGVIVSDDTTNPSSRGGTGFSQFFGLNDLFASGGNTIPTTGLKSTDVGGFVPGGSMTLLLKGPNGERVNETTVAVMGTTIGDMVTALNTAFSGNASFALDANGQLKMTPSSNFQNYDLEVTQDTTVRGGTGEGFSQMFGLGTGEKISMAQSFRLTPALTNSPQGLAFAQSSLSASTALGTVVAGAGDNRGLLALQNLGNVPVNFAGGGGLPARTTTLNDYAATFYQDIATRGTAIDATRTAQNTRLTQGQKNQSQVEGVNLDDELSKMMSLQQAYNAGARLLSVAQSLFDQLLQAV